MRDHLSRLPPEYYLGEAVVHWSLTIRDRKEGWLDVPAHFRFRELMVHTSFRYALASPIYCLMPDHLHFVWMGLNPGSHQLNAMKHFRRGFNLVLKEQGSQLQDQSYDHVLRDDERQPEGFREICEYIARNPERARLIAPDQFASYPFSGCIVPGYPELKRFSPDFENRFATILSYLKQNGLFRLAP
jgi:putative transposase